MCACVHVCVHAARVPSPIHADLRAKVVHHQHQHVLRAGRGGLDGRRRQQRWLASGPAVLAVSSPSFAAPADLEGPRAARGAPRASVEADHAQLCVATKPHATAEGVMACMRGENHVKRPKNRKLQVT